MNVAALTPNDIVNMRGYWQGLPEAPAELPRPTVQTQPAQEMSKARQLLASSLATAGNDVTAAVGPFALADRVPPDVALAYAAQAGSKTRLGRTTVAEAPAARAPAVVTTKGTASIAIKPAETVARSHLARTAERLNDPWLRGLVMTASVQRGMTVTVYGDPDYRVLTPYLHKPGAAVMMTFTHDPHLGMTAEAFTGSAVVFQATVTFSERRTASLN
jgi:hypothetical protein